MKMMIDDNKEDNKENDMMKMILMKIEILMAIKQMVKWGRFRISNVGIVRQGILTDTELWDRNW